MAGSYIQFKHVFIVRTIASVYNPERPKFSVIRPIKSVANIEIGFENAGTAARIKRF